MATRLWFPATEAAAVSPAFEGGWVYTSESVRRRLTHVKGSSAIAEGAQIGPWDENVGLPLDRQYVSDPLEGAQTISGTVKCQLMCRQVGDVDVDGCEVSMRVVTNDGSTVRGNLLSSGINRIGPTGQLINNASHRNKTVASSGTSLSSVSAQDGDRIVVEIGYNNNWAFTDNPVAAAKWGENATDLPENETQTSPDGAGWIEFSANLVFESGGGPPPPPPSSTFAVRRHISSQDVDTAVVLGTTDAFHKSAIWIPVDRAELQTMQMGMTRGPETPATNVQMEDAWLNVESFPVGAPGSMKVDLKQFRRRFGAGR